MKKTLLGIIIVNLILLAGMILKNRELQAKVAQINEIPTFREIQRLVGAHEDGIIGPNTLEKWERKLCDQYAKDEWERIKK